MSMWTEEHDMIRKTVRRFVNKEINPYVDEWERGGHLPAHELFKKAGDLGLLGSRPRSTAASTSTTATRIAAAEELGGAVTAAASPWPWACRPTCAPCPLPLWIRSAAP